MSTTEAIKGHVFSAAEVVKEQFAYAQDDAVFELALSSINYLGSWILLFSVGVALFNFGLLVVQFLTGIKFKMQFAVTQPNLQVLTLDHIKLELGRLVSFSLLLLVAADVLETLLKPMHDLSMEDLYKMALVGGIRTTLAFFLGKEMEEIVHHLHVQHKHESHEESTQVAVSSPPAGNSKSKKKKNN